MMYWSYKLLNVVTVVVQPTSYLLLLVTHAKGIHGNKQIHPKIPGKPLKEINNIKSIFTPTPGLYS